MLDKIVWRELLSSCRNLRGSLSWVFVAKRNFVREFVCENTKVAECALVIGLSFYSLYCEEPLLMSHNPSNKVGHDQ